MTTLYSNKDKPSTLILIEPKPWCIFLYNTTTILFNFKNVLTYVTQRKGNKIGFWFNTI